MDFYLHFADGAHAVQLRGFPAWLATALAAEWYVETDPGSQASHNGPAVAMRAQGRWDGGRSRRDGSFALRWRDGRLIAQRQHVRVDLASPAVVVDHPEGEKAAWDAALVAQTKVAILRSLAPWGVLALHGAGLAVGGHEVLCLGPTSSGKSTLAVLALRQGGRIVSDDSLLVWLGSEGLQVAPLRRDVHLRRETEPLLPAHWRQLAFPEQGQERLTLARGAAPAAFLSRLLPRTLLLPRIDRRRASTRVRAIAQGEAMAAVILATSAAYLAQEFPDLHRATWGVAQRLAIETQCFRVELGRDLLTAPEEAWRRIEEGFAAAAP